DLLLSRKPGERVSPGLDLPADQKAVHSSDVYSGFRLTQRQFVNHQRLPRMSVTGGESRVDGGPDSGFAHRRIVRGRCTLKRKCHTDAVDTGHDRAASEQPSPLPLPSRHGDGAVLLTTAEIAEPDRAKRSAPSVREWGSIPWRD